MTPPSRPAAPDRGREALRLILITRPATGSGHPDPVIETVVQALHAGCRAVQVRDKRGARALARIARALRGPTRDAGALLFVNDRLDVALSVEADGLHLGPDDIPVADARNAAGPDLLIGYSASNADEARDAVRQGADYIGCGSVFKTRSKQDAGEPIGPVGLARVVDAVSVPVVAIGGIEPERVPAVRATGAAGCAVISAIMDAADPGAATQAFLQAWRDDIARAPA